MVAFDVNLHHVSVSEEVFENKSLVRAKYLDTQLDLIHEKIKVCT